MTSPIDRAAEALATADRRLWSVASEKDREQYRDFVRAVFESIDPDDLAKVLADEGWTCEYHEPDPNCTECQTLQPAPSSPA